MAMAKKETPKKVDIFGAAKRVEKPTSKATDKTVVEVDKMEKKLNEYKFLNQQIKALEAKVEAVRNNIIEVSKEKFIELYRDNGRNPKTFILKDGDGCVMVIPYDAYAKIKTQERADEIIEKYGEEAVNINEKYVFNNDVLERNMDAIRKLIGEAKNISTEDKENLIRVETSYEIKKGFIDNLYRDYEDNMEEVLDDVKPTIALKDCGDRYEEGGVAEDADLIGYVYEDASYESGGGVDRYAPEYQEMLRGDKRGTFGSFNIVHFVDGIIKQDEIVRAGYINNVIDMALVQYEQMGSPSNSKIVVSYLDTAAIIKDGNVERLTKYESGGGVDRYAPEYQEMLRGDKRGTFGSFNIVHFVDGIIKQDEIVRAGYINNVIDMALVQYEQMGSPSNSKIVVSYLDTAAIIKDGNVERLTKYESGGGVGSKRYFHILEYGENGEINHISYFLTLEEAQKEIERLNSIYPNNNYSPFVSSSKNPPSIVNSYESGGGIFGYSKRPKSALMRDRAYKSEEAHEIAYKRKKNPKNPRYKHEEGGSMYESGGGVGDTIADRYARLTEKEAKRLDELSEKVRINEQTESEDIEWDKLVHKYRGWEVPMSKRKHEEGGSMYEAGGSTDTFITPKGRKVEYKGRNKNGKYVYNWIDIPSHYLEVIGNGGQFMNKITPEMADKMIDDKIENYNKFKDEKFAKGGGVGMNREKIFKFYEKSPVINKSGKGRRSSNVEYVVSLVPTGDWTDTYNLSITKNSEDEIGSVMRVVPNSDALHIYENLEKSNVRFFYRHWKGDSNTNTYEAGGDIPSEISTEELESKVGRKLNGWGDDTVICEGVTYKKCFLKPYYKKA